jgi:hypothetical protein
MIFVCRPFTLSSPSPRFPSSRAGLHRIPTARISRFTFLILIAVVFYLSHTRKTCTARAAQEEGGED